MKHSADICRRPGVPPRHGTAQAGFTLVELMVSVALGLLLMVALIAVYLNVSRTNTEMAKTNSLIENGRFAMDILAEDIEHAGFWGGYLPTFDDFSLRNTVPSDVPKATSVDLGPCLAYATWDADYRDMLIGIPVQVYAGVPTGCSAVVVDRKAGTDVLVVRHAENCAYTYNGAAWIADSANCEAYNANKAYFQASFCDNETQATPALRFVLYNNPTNDAALFALKRRGCTGAPPAPTVGTRAPLRKLVSNIYYVRTWASTAGDGIPTLVRASFNVNGTVPVHAPADALIEGVENLAVELGIDSKSRCGTDVNYNLSLPPVPVAGGNLVNPATCAFSAAVVTSNTMPTVRGDGVPESFTRCGATGCTAAQLTDVVAVKLFVLARSRDPSQGQADTKTYTLGTNAPTTVTPSGAETAYKRHVFQTTIRLANTAGRRETP